VEPKNRAGRLNRIARYAQRLRQRARGRQGFAHGQRRIEDQLADAALDAHVARQRGLRRVSQPGFERFELCVFEHG